MGQTVLWKRLWINCGLLNSESNPKTVCKKPRHAHISCRIFSVFFSCPEFRIG